MDSNHVATSPPPVASRWTLAREAGGAALLAASLGWTLLLAIILRHSIFVTNDSVSNYAHVWYISQRLWDDHQIPLHMPVLAHGRAYAFPYGFLPWITAALLRPLIGDWIVTLWLVLGAAGAVLGTFWAFPELRRGWWATAVLVNPFLIAAPVLGQLPFLWAMTLLLLTVGLWRRGRVWPAALVAGLAGATHPAVVLPLAGLLVVGRLPWEPRPRRLLGAFAVSLVIAAPAAALTLASPAVQDVPRRVLLLNFVGTVAARGAVVALPLALLALRRRRRGVIAALAVAVLLALNLELAPLLQTNIAAKGLFRSPDTGLLAYLDSPEFVPGATYRILRVADGKIGMYQILQHGGTLDSELFPESIDRRSWSSTSAYADFLAGRDVDVVIIYDAYDALYGTNEHQLLRDLAAAPISGQTAGPTCASLRVHTATYDVFAIHHTCPPAPDRRDSPPSATCPMCRFQGWGTP